MSIDIFIVAYHAREILADTLATIAKWSSPGYRLTVYENSAMNYPLTWLWNRFFEKSTRNLVALLNPDILVGPGWDTEAEACMTNDPSCAAVSPISNHAPHREILTNVIPDDVSIDMIEGLTARIRREFANSRFVNTQDHRQVCGHCYIIRRDAWTRINGFNECIRFAGNDYDFNERAVRAGMHLAVLTHAMTFHRWNSSTRDAIRLGTFDVGSNTPRFSDPPAGADFLSI